MLTISGGPSPTETTTGYGKNGGKASFGNPPSVVVGGASEAVAPPAIPGTFKIGVDKNVSAIIGY